jgi:hypothetical protein
MDFWFEGVKPVTFASSAEPDDGHASPRHATCWSGRISV